MRDDRQRILDILDAAEKIEKHTGGGKTVFENNELVQTWSFTTYKSLVKPQAKYPGPPWKNIRLSRGAKLSVCETSLYTDTLA